MYRTPTRSTLRKARPPGVALGPVAQIEDMIRGYLECGSHSDVSKIFRHLEGLLRTRPGRRKALKKFKDGSSTSSGLRWTALHCAAHAGLPSAVVGTLRHAPPSPKRKAGSSGSYIDRRARFGFTALHLASLQNNKTTVEILLQHGADVHATDDYGWTALHFAVLDRPEELRITLDRVLYPDLTDSPNPRKIPARDARLSFGNFVGFRARSAETAESIVKLLLRHGANPKAKRNDGVTAIYMAYVQERYGKAKPLLSRILCGMEQCGCEHSQRLHPRSVGCAARRNDEILLWNLLNDGHTPDNSCEGRSALYWACLHGNCRIVEMLVDHGARGDRSGHRGDNQYIPLDIAAKGNNYNVIRTLLRTVGNREVPDEQGRTAWEISLESNPCAYNVRAALLGFDGRIVISGDCSPRLNDSNQTWVDAALEKRDVDLLIWASADHTDLPLSKGQVLFLEAEKGDEEIFGKLMRFIRHISSDLMVQFTPKSSGIHTTAMGVAADNGHAKIAESICRWMRCNSDTVPPPHHFGATLKSDVPIVDLVLLGDESEIIQDYRGRHSLAKALHQQGSLLDMPSLLERSITSEHVYATWFLLEHGCEEDVPAAHTARGRRFLPLVKNLGPCLEPSATSEAREALRSLLAHPDLHYFPNVVRQLGCMVAYFGDLLDESMWEELSSLRASLTANPLRSGNEPGNMPPSCSVGAESTYSHSADLSRQDLDASPAPMPPEPCTLPSYNNQDLDTSPPPISLSFHNNQDRDAPPSSFLNQDLDTSPAPIPLPLWTSSFRNNQDLDASPAPMPKSLPKAIGKWSGDRFPCVFPGCESVCSRSADLNRHYSSVHFPHNSKFDCPRNRCSRKGKNGFTRQDHLTEHLRSYHGDGIPKRPMGKRSGSSIP